MPDVGEYINTPDGKALVEDVNIFKNKIKTRLVTEDRADGRAEKLSPEFYIYSKEDISRDAHRRYNKHTDAQKANKEKEASASELAALED